VSEVELAFFRNRTIGYVFQSFHLVPSLTAFENITFPAEMNRDPQGADRAKELLRRVDLIKRMNNFPHQLSGGEKQRVFIAKALATEPKALILDEPLSNVDVGAREELFKLLKELNKNIAIIVVDHNFEILSKYSKEIVCVNKCVEKGAKYHNITRGHAKAKEGH